MKNSILNKMMRTGWILLAFVLVQNLANAQAGVCPGDSVVLTLSGYTGSIQWEFADSTANGPYSALTGVTGDSANYTPTMSGWYRAVVTTGTCNPFYSDTVYIEVYPAPRVDMGSNGQICAGDSVMLGGSPAGTGGTPPFTYAWSPSTGLSSDTVGNPMASPATTTQYTLMVTDASGCSDMGTTTVTVNPLPLAEAGPDTTLVCGDSLNLQGSATLGTAPFSYSWSPGGNLSDSTIANPNTGPVYGSGVTYFLSVTDSNGCSDIDSVSLAVAGGSSGVDSFAYTGSIVTWTVPCTDSITIEVWGAQGGRHTTSNIASGLGAYQKGTFAITPNTQLKILVGEQPSITTGNGNGGGGGSFVTLSNNTPIIIAGGGGGSANTTDSPNKHGQAGTSGGQGAAGGGAGGTNGSGGSIGSSGFQSGAGGGLLTDGADGWSSNTGGDAFVNGGVGGTTNGTARGGFGGGGSGSQYVVGGGGGGYSGGGSGGNSSAGVGGGGGSFNSGANPVSQSGIQSGHGKVKITW